MEKIRVVIADDSAFMRKAIRSILESDPSIEIVATAQNGRRAVELARSLKPDIMTMDVEMPIMNGLEALEQIMASEPVPVIMISSLTHEGADATMEALSRGAVDFLPKDLKPHPQSLNRMRGELLAKVKSIAKNRLLKMRLRRGIGAKSSGAGGSSVKEGKLTLKERIALRKESILQRTGSDRSKAEASRAGGSVRSTRSAAGQTSGRKRPRPSHFDLLVLGVSTGGPLALHSVLPRLPATLPVGMLIVQHMPPHFTRSLADRLNSLSHLKVKEAADGDRIEAGSVLIAPGGKQMVLGRDKFAVKISDEPSDTLHKPSVDVMMASVVKRFSGNILGVIMTGMGRDGADGLQLIHNAGGYVLSQDEESCVVYGMPKAVVDAGIADEIYSLENLASAIATCLGVSAVSPKDE